MPKFSAASEAKLVTCHKDLQLIFREVGWLVDCTIVEGWRDMETQNEYFRLGKSKLQYPDSKHNEYPSMAVDVMKYYPDRPHLHWSDKDGMEEFALFVTGTAEHLHATGEIKHLVRWGADWDMDGVRVDKDPDENFFDGPHFELYKPEEF